MDVCCQRAVALETLYLIGHFTCRVKADEWLFYDAEQISNFLDSPPLNQQPENMKNRKVFILNISLSGQLVIHNLVANWLGFLG